MTLSIDPHKMRSALLFILGIMMSSNFIGCNIFSWTGSKEESHIDRGLELMKNEQYAEAEVEFARALQEDPFSSDARYYHAKAIVSRCSVGASDLLQKITTPEREREQEGAALPLYSIRETAVADEVYRVNLIIVEDLRPIYDDLTHGRISAEDIDLDLAIAYFVSGILSLRDTNRNGAIDEADLLLDIDYSSALGEYGIVGLHQFLGEGAMSHSPKIGWPPVNPGDINPLIDSVLNLIEESADILIAAVQEIAPDASVENITAFIDDVRTTITKYYYDDDRDNDGDGVVDEENLNELDDDGDDLIDEDTDGV